MTEVKKKDIQKYSKIFLNFSIVFLALSITLYLFISDREEERSKGFVEKKIEDTMSVISEQASKVADVFLPIRTSIRATDSLETIQAENLSATTTDVESHKVVLKDIINNPTVQNAFLKGILGILLAFLFLTYALRKP